MSGDGNPTDRPFDCHDLRVAVVAASWHEQVMNGLLESALDALKRHQVESPVVVRVPGSFELPVATRPRARRSRPRSRSGRSVAANISGPDLGGNLLDTAHYPWGT